MDKKMLKKRRKILRRSARKRTRAISGQRGRRQPPRKNQLGLKLQQLKRSEPSSNLSTRRLQTLSDETDVVQRLQVLSAGQGAVVAKVGRAEGASRLSSWFAQRALQEITANSRIDEIERRQGSLSQRSAPHRDRSLGPSSSRRCCMGDDIGPVTQVHRRATRRSAAASRCRAPLGASGAAAMPLRNAETSSDKTNCSPPKGRCTFSIDSRRPRRAYLLARCSVGTNIATKQQQLQQQQQQQQQQLQLQSSEQRQSGAQLIREAAAKSDGSDGNAKIRPTSGRDQLLQQILLTHQRVEVPPSSPPLPPEGRRRSSNQARAPPVGLDRLRPPVQRLKSMPPSAERATYKNNRSPVARRGVSWIGAGAATIRTSGGNSNSPANILAFGPRIRSNPAGSSHNACRPVGDGGSNVTSTSGHRSVQYLRRRRLAGIAQMANDASARPAPAEAAPLNVVSNFNQNDQSHQFDGMEQVKKALRPCVMRWSKTDKSHECIVNADRLTLCFHPHCSEGAAACRAASPLLRNGNYYYWEIKVHDKIYGSSVMFGLCTKQQRMHYNDYKTLVGIDKNGWSLSHKGQVWHNGVSKQYTEAFASNQPITVGLLFNTLLGELSYFMDGKNLGVAFTGLNEVQDELYPVVGSTAKCTLMTLVGSYSGFRTGSLIERSCYSLLKSINVDNRLRLIEYLLKQKLPKHLLQYVATAANVSCETIAEIAISNNITTTQQQLQQLQLPPQQQQQQQHRERPASGTVADKHGLSSKCDGVRKVTNGGTTKGDTATTCMREPSPSSSVNS